MGRNDPVPGAMHPVPVVTLPYSPGYASLTLGYVPYSPGLRFAHPGLRMVRLPGASHYFRGYALLPPDNCPLTTVP